MIDKLKYFTVNGVTYPQAFTLNVIELIQEKYNTLDNFFKVMQPKSGEPKIKDLIWILQEIINEGIDIENENKNENRVFLTHKQVGRLITDKDQAKMMITNIISDSTKTGEEDPNETTKQNLTEK